MVFKDSKRPPTDDDLYQLSCKHPRHLEYGNNVASFLVHEKPHVSVGDGQESFNTSQDEERVTNRAVTDVMIGESKDFEVSGFGSISSLSWVTSSASKEESRSEPGLRISCSPRLFEYDRLARSLIPSEEIFSSLMDYPPRKPVSIGPNHQADVPEWCLDGTETATTPEALNANLDANDVFPQLSPSGGKGSHPAVDDSNWDRMAGTCVIPMPSATGPDQCSHVGFGRTDCECPDVSSVGCVRQHVMEARDKLKETIGQELFVYLGFCEMGEDVAQRWSEEEEQMFHAVVFSNPASLGKNFWDHLSQVFPLRTKKELVSYYFNVFMLRRRAEQNRSHPANIDSDNEEWQGSDDGGEFAMIEEEDDYSAVESPAIQEHVVHISEGGDCHEDDEDEDDDDYDINNDGGDDDVDDDTMSEDDDGGLDDISEAHFGSTQISGKLSDDFSSIPSNKNAGGEPQNASNEYRCSHADSSGLSAAAVMQESRVEIACNKTLHDEFGDDVIRDPVVDHGYILESPCKVKSWNIQALPGPEKVDFLSTTNMIDEVFGNVAQNDNETKDSPHRS